MPRKPTLPSIVEARRARLASLLLLLLLPTVLLWPSLFGNHDFVPFDLTVFPPASVGLDPQEIAARREGGNFDITEKTLLCAPEYRLAREEIVEGRFPHWNPWVRAGAPLFANALDGFAYPVHWLMLSLSPERAFGFAAWIAFALAGVFMFGFLGEVGLRILPALFGAMVFQLSGTLAANAHFFMRMETLLWLPATFWAVERLFKQAGVRRIPACCALAVSLGMCWLAGFPPYALACSFALGLYVLALAARTVRERGWRAGLALGTWSGTAIALGIAIAAVQMMPMLDYFPEAQRDLQQDIGKLSSQGLDPIALLGLLMPAPFGGPLESGTVPYEHNPLVYLGYTRADPTTGRLHFPANYNYTEYALFLGTLPLLCILLAMFRGSVRFRHFALPAFVFFLAFAAGGLLFRPFASIGVFRSLPPLRFAAPACFFGAALAAMGMEGGRSMQSRARHRTALAITVVLALVCGWIWLRARGLANDPEAAGDWLFSHLAERWRESYPGVADDRASVLGWFGPYLVPALRHLAAQAGVASIALVLGGVWLFFLPARTGWPRFTRHALTLLALVVTAGELGFYAHLVNPSFPRRTFPDTPVQRFLREQRVATRESGGFMVARVARTPRLPDALPPNLLIPEHIRDLNCYAFTDGRSYRPFRQLYGPEQMMREFWLKALPADARLKQGLFDLFGVRYLLSTEALPELGPPAIPPLTGPGGGFWVYERTSALPRAFFARGATLVSNDEDAIGLLCAPDFDPRAAVWLHADDDHAIDLHAPVAAEQLAAATVKFRRDEPCEVRILIEGSPGAWLVLTDTAMSNWRATLDGGDTPWHRADLCFRAVWIPPGSHEVTFQYTARPFVIGLVITALGFAIVLLLLIWWNGSPNKEAPDLVAASSG